MAGRIALVCLSLAVLPLAAGQQILHHEIHVRVHPRESMLEGDCTITVSRPAAAHESITFDLLDGTVLSVEADGEPVRGYQYDGDAGMAKAFDTKRLVVPLPDRAGAGPLELRVRYRDESFTGSATNPEDNQPFSLGQIDAKRGSFSSHIPYYPYVRYQGRGGDIFLTVPDDELAVSSGQLVETVPAEPGWTTYHWHSERGSGLLPYPFACHRYRTLEQLGADDRTRITIYHLPEDERFANQKMAIVQDVFAFYLEVFGDYPFPKLALVETDLQAGNIGLAAQSVVMLSKAVWFATTLDPKNTSLSNQGMIVLADEIAHQWNAYKVATPNYLAEGISRYTDSLYMAHRGGEEVLREHMRFTRRQYFGLLERGAGDIAISDPRVTPALYFIKGALALDMLRTALGAETFLDGMRGYFTDCADQVTDLRGFSGAFEQAAGEPLFWFFDQWYNRGQHPVLRLAWSTCARGSEFVTAITITQCQPGPPYRLSLPALLRGAAGGSHAQVVAVERREQTFEARTSFEPESVVLDPEQRMPVEVRAD